MDKEKEIEEMATAMAKIDFAVPYQEKEKHSYGLYGYIAENLINAGYGNVKQAIKEFAKRIKMEFYYEFEELIPSIMANKIDNLITELYGADE